VHKALASVGDIGSKTVSILWHVIGSECTLKEWSIRQNWQGSSRDASTAKGILISALERLHEHYENVA
jgi:hypothetical protein